MPRNKDAWKQGTLQRVTEREGVGRERCQQGIFHSAGRGPSWENLRLSTPICVRKSHLTGVMLKK